MFRGDKIVGAGEKIYFLSSELEKSYLIQSQL